CRRRTARSRSVRLPTDGGRRGWFASGRRTRARPSAQATADTRARYRSWRGQDALEPVRKCLARELLRHVQLEPHAGVLDQLDRVPQALNVAAGVGGQLVRAVVVADELARAAPEARKVRVPERDELQRQVERARLRPPPRALDP